MNRGSLIDGALNAGALPACARFAVALGPELAPALFALDPALLVGAAVRFRGSGCR